VNYTFDSFRVSATPKIIEGAITLLSGGGDFHRRCIIVTIDGAATAFKSPECPHYSIGLLEMFL
jgi:hypothetical protein